MSLYPDTPQQNTATLRAPSPQPGGLQPWLIKNVGAPIKAVGNFLTGSTQAFGKTIGDSLAAPGNADLYAQSQQQAGDLNYKLSQSIKDRKAKGQDTSKSEAILKDNLANPQTLEDYTGNVINTTPEQVIGQGIGTGLEALSGGVLSTGAEEVLPKTLSLGQKVVGGAKIGATYGGISGLSQGLQSNENAGGVAGSTATGAAVGAAVGAGTSAVIGGAQNVWEKAYAPKTGGTYDTNLADATAVNNQAGATATNSIHEASDTMGDVNRSLGDQFANAPDVISKADPQAGVNLPKDVVDKLNALKDTKAFSLPSYIREPGLPSNIENIGNGNVRLNPAQAQDLITQLNDLKFNSKGDVVINQQASNLVNDVKTAAQSGLGHVTDAQGNSVWGRAYADYSQGKDAMEAMSKIIPVKNVPGEMLDPTEVNNSVNKMMKMMETPQGTQALLRGNADFQKVTGYDLLGDPMGSISKLAESDKAFADALKGNWIHQVGQAVKNPNKVGGRILYATGAILGIASLSGQFRKAVGNFFTGQ